MNQISSEAILEARLLQELNNLSPKNNSAFIKGLVEDYLTQTPARIEIMLKGSTTEIASEAHVIKSTSGALGALKLQQKARELENFIHENQTEKIKSSISEIQSIYVLTKTEMQNFIKNLG